MKKIETVLRHMTDSGAVLKALREALREADPAFAGLEEKFRRDCAGLEREWGEAACAGAYLSAREEQLAMELIYMGWEGFLLNLRIFRNPVNALLLQGDFEELCGERRLGALPAIEKAQQTVNGFFTARKELSESTRQRLDEVNEFYSYLQTMGYRAAHYFGFRLADCFLPYVIAGYRADPVRAFQYRGRLERYLGLDPEKLL